jgi:Fe-S-cluster-containing hydrogenase component 2
MPLIETQPLSCLVRLYSHSECRRCQEVCPASAITLDGGRVRVDHSACVGCGLCISVCPTSVFSVRGLDLGAFLDKVVEGSGDTLTLSCACTSAASETMSDTATVLPCLSMLDDDLVLALAGKGVRKLVLQMGDAERCVLHAGGLIDSTVARVQERWPGRLEVEMRHERGAPDDAAFSEVLDDLAEHQVDRREFLRGIVERARTVLDEAPADKKEWGPRPLPTRIPTSRGVLLTSIHESDPVAFPRIAISDSCDDCQDAYALCGRFCPSGALSRVESEANVEFVFQPEICVDCGQCAFVCPQDAILRQEEGPGRGAITLLTFPKGTCARCGREAANLVDGLCPACSRRSDLKGSFLDWVRQSE